MKRLQPLALILLLLGFTFALPDRLTLTGKQLSSPLPTNTPYLEYIWLEAEYDGVMTAFIVLMDKELDRLVIGFVHMMIEVPEENRFISSAKYWAWLNGGEIIRLENREMADAYVARHKAQRDFMRFKEHSGF